MKKNFETKIMSIDSDSLALAKELILSGELVAFPTETVYGLGGSAFFDDAVKNIFVAKGRPQDNPLIVHISDFTKAVEITSNISKKALLLAAKFMPGAITLVLEKNEKVSDLVSCGLGTIGVRVPSSLTARAFLEYVDVPIAAPSANTSKRPSPTSASHVYDDLQGKIPLILNGGNCAFGIESTVIDMTGEIPVILRPGIITKSQIESVVGDVFVSDSTSGKVTSPGMKYRHYAPRCEMTLFLNASAVDKMYTMKTMIFAFEESLSLFKGKNVVSLGKNNAEASNRFYAYLRMHENDYDAILCEYPKDDELGLSLLNRMMKASNNQIIK